MWFYTHWIYKNKSILIYLHTQIRLTMYQLNESSMVTVNDRSELTIESISTIDYYMEYYWHKYGDPRVEPFPLMKSLQPTITILALWSLFVLYVGPRFMSKRSPFSLRPILIVYNLTMSLANAYFFYLVMYYYNYGLDSFMIKFPTFERIDLNTMSSIRMSHLYLLTKFIDLLDTIFFVLRKKQSQVTWLHFYHHLTVPLIGWIHFRLCGANVVCIPFAVMNTLIHTIMYAYYGLAAIGPHMQPYLWWKRYITTIQIGQFALLFAYSLYFTLFQEGYHFMFSVNIVIQSIFYFILFYRFYIQTYQKSMKKNITIDITQHNDATKKDL